jgi:phosphomannomutase
LINFNIEDIAINEDANGLSIIKLPELTEVERNIINPLVAPTSGLRVQVYDQVKENDYILTKRKLYLFLRVFKAISHKAKEMINNPNLKILIVTDNRPSKDIMLKYCSAIFAHEGFEIFHQKDVLGESKISAPYGAASIALYNDIDIIIVLTASHNDLTWNGIKFYIKYPMPMSGNIFKEISKKALNYEEIRLKMDFKPVFIDAEQKNNEYVTDLLSNILEIKSLKGKNIIIWPYLGKARGIVNLFKSFGTNVILIEEEIDPPNPIKMIQEEKLQKVMIESKSNLALLLDADRDRIALYVKQNGDFFTYIPNEIYSAMHNILAKEYNKKIINVRTIPSDLRADHTSFMNILTGVGYKHLGAILYFILGVDVDQSKIDTAILYLEDLDGKLVKINKPDPLKQVIVQLMEKEGSNEEKFIIVMWEESGGHTLNIIDVSKNIASNTFEFKCQFPLIADKYPVPALVLIAELICRGHLISESIDWTIKGINQTIHAVDEEKIKLMKNFLVNDNKTINIEGKNYHVTALSDNNGMIDIFQLKSDNSTVFFRPSGTGPDIRFYIFGNRETYEKELNTVMKYVNVKYK